MATRLGPSIALMIGLALAPSPARAQAAPDDLDAIRNGLGLCRVQLRNLAASVRARLDEADAVMVQTDEHRRRLMDQKMAVTNADMAYQEAKFAAEVAEVVVLEYEKGTMKQELETVEGDIALSKASLKNAEDRFERSQAHLKEIKDLVARIDGMPKERISDLMSEFYAVRERDSAEARVQADKFGVDKERLGIEQAETKKHVLLKYQGPKRLKELGAEVEKAKSVALARKAEWELAKGAEAQAELNALVIDDRALTPAEWAALAKFGALEPAWKGIIARRDAIEKADPAKRAEMRRMVDDFAKSLDEADRAWSSAREARLDDRDAALMRHFRSGGK